MTRRDDGGPAYPVLPPVESDGQVPTGYPFPSDGMTLRDWFAGQALAAMGIAAPYTDCSARYCRDCAARAYQYADAMIAERGKDEGSTS